MRVNETIADFSDTFKRTFHETQVPHDTTNPICRSPIHPGV